MNHIPESLDHDGRIRIEAYHLGCEEELYTIIKHSQPQLNHWMGWCPDEYTFQDTKSWVSSRIPAWRTGEEYDFLIKDNASGDILGSCGLNNLQVDHGMANLGYWVRSDRTGLNIATETTQLLEDFGFTYLQLTRLEIVVAKENAASQRVAEKAGAQREGLLRNRVKIGSQTHDAYLFSLIPEET